MLPELLRKSDSLTSITPLLSSRPVLLSKLCCWDTVPHIQYLTIALPFDDQFKRFFKCWWPYWYFSYQTRPFLPYLIGLKWVKWFILPSKYCFIEEIGKSLEMYKIYGINIICEYGQEYRSPVFLQRPITRPYLSGLSRIFNEIGTMKDNCYLWHDWHFGQTGKDSEIVKQIQNVSGFWWWKRRRWRTTKGSFHRRSCKTKRAGGNEACYKSCKVRV